MLKPKPVPCADRLGGEERLEQALLQFRRDAGTVVGDFDQHVLVFRDGAQADQPCRLSSGERVGGVVEQDRPDLIEFAAVSGDARQVAVVLRASISMPFRRC